MNLTAFFALVRRDLRLFFQDRRAMLMSFVAPILIASFFGYLFGGASDRPASKIDVSAVDQDGSAISRKVVASMAAEAALDVSTPGIEKARESVRSGKTTVAIVIPPGFGDRAAQAFFGAGNQPEIALLYDPSQGPEMQMVRGILTQHVMEAVSTETFSGPASQRYVDNAMRSLNAATGMVPADKDALGHLLGDLSVLNRRQSENAGGVFRSGLNMPYTVRQEAVTARKGVAYNGMAHSFAGMTVQFILFMGIDAGLVVLAQRRTGIWKRLQAAPISRFTLIGSRAFSAAAIAGIILVVVFSFARVAFGVKVEGSFPGFVGVCAAFALMTATFGLLVAVLGKTPEATRGIAILVTLLLVMLGGSWVPAFLFPQWLQRVTFLIPTRWAVDGLDGMIWRGMGWHDAVGPILALLGFAALFGLVAVWRFRWETEG